MDLLIIIALKETEGEKMCSSGEHYFHAWKDKAKGHNHG